MVFRLSGEPRSRRSHGPFFTKLCPLRGMRRPPCGRTSYPTQWRRAVSAYPADSRDLPDDCPKCGQDTIVRLSNGECYHGCTAAADLRAMRIGREHDDLAWRKLWEKEKQRAQELERTLITILAPQPFGHTRTKAINGKCSCRWCKAHRLISDDAWSSQHKGKAEDT